MTTSYEQDSGNRARKSSIHLLGRDRGSSPNTSQERSKPSFAPNAKNSSQGQFDEQNMHVSPKYAQESLEEPG